MFDKLSQILSIPELKNKLLITAGLLVVYRVGIFIPLPGIDVAAVNAWKDSQTGAMAGLMSVADMFTGGGIGALFTLGIMPYITASIIFQLLVAIVPSLSRISHEGATGRKKITQYTRLATLGLCLVQSAMMCGVIYNQGTAGGAGVPQFIAGAASFPKWEFYLYGITCLTVGTMFLMWLGEQIDEFGIGNGISLIIMGGIISRMPSAVKKLLFADSSDPFAVTMILVMFVAMTVAVVLITLGTRRVGVQQSKATRGRKVYGGQRQSLPLKVNQSGVIPIIFAQALLYVPMIGFGWLKQTWGWNLEIYFMPSSFLYTMVYVTLIMFFCYFYTAVTFNPNEMSDNLKQSGMYIPGIRPGKRTADHLEKIMSRIALAGSVFLAFIAIIPSFVNTWLKVDYAIAGMLGGTGLLIVVGVALDMVQRVESYMLVRNYEGLGAAGGRIRGRRG